MISDTELELYISVYILIYIRGACLTGRWSWDGAGIVTSGEDGAVKIWSRLVIIVLSYYNPTINLYVPMQKSRDSKL